MVKKKTNIIALAIGLFMIAIIVVGLLVTSGEREQPLTFTVVEKEDTSLPGTPRMVFRILIETEQIPTEDSLRKTAETIWEDGNKNWKWFTVFMYLPEMDTASVAYGVADFTPRGLKEFKIQEVALYGTKWES
ncbi:hypothetical protein KAV79_07675 [Candidatus Aerophobetes bacterium]|nr:hypothetical protein [Candidatus Aerophobetes bacterium]